LAASRVVVKAGTAEAAATDLKNDRRDRCS
jgi:hypothetical protein